MDLAKASRLADMMARPGWKDAKSILDELRLDAIDQMGNKLDRGVLTLTGQALYRGIRKGITEFQDEVERSLKILTPPTKKAGRSGGKT